MPDPSPSAAPTPTVAQLGDTSRPAEETNAATDPHETRTYVPTGPGRFPFLSPPERPGDLGRLGPYHVVRLLGQGAMGFVFEGYDEVLQRSVALKVMKPDVAAHPTARERFLREGRAAAAVKNDHVVTIYQVGEANDVPFLALEYLEGQSLADWLQSHPGPVSADMIATVARDALRGLAAAHAKGLVHRDIKPANLWVESGPGRESGEPRIKVLDFGLTRPGKEEPGLTQSGAVLGTPAYMAPEQAAGRPVDARADLFSLGVVLYRMASGHNPFQRDTVYATLSALATVTPPPASTLNRMPSRLAAFIDVLMSKDPAGRPTDAGAALGDWQSQRAATPPRRRPWALWALAGMVAAVLLLVAVWRPFGGSPAPTTPVGGRTPIDDGRTPGVDPGPPPLRITSFDIEHYARVAGGVEDKGLFGQGTFAARQKDVVRLRATLSRPAYAYLIAFRPDGVVELCYPEAANQAPPLSESASYPSTVASRTKGYGLDEGAGLWVFAAVVSETPLPPYTEWIRRHPLTAPKGASGSPGTVLVDDGDGPAVRHAAHVQSRGKGVDIPGFAEVAGVTRSLQAAAPGSAVKTIGIVAAPAE